MRALALTALVFVACGKELFALTPFPCARDHSCPASFVCVEQQLCQPWETCELAGSNTCSSAANPRCTIVSSPIGGFTTLCVHAPLGTPSGEGAQCSASAQGLYKGTDDCAAGDICYDEGSSIAGSETVLHCRRFCGSDTDCANGSKCAQAFSGSEFVNIQRGVCEPGCGMFTTICSELNHHCDVLPKIEGGGSALTVCRANGTVDAGGNCNNASCKAGLVCIPGIAPFQTAPTCRVPCDGTHLCATGTCETSAFQMGNGVGFCH